MDKKKLKQIQNEINDLVKQAGEKVMSFYGQPGEIKDKGHDSPLTRADLASNEILMTGLKKFGWPILSEEGADNADRLTANLTWIIDPLDGTKDFIQQTGEFTIMVGLVERQENNTFRPILGIIYRPVTETIYSAIENGGAWLKQSDDEPKKLEVTKEKSWTKMTILTSRFHTTELEKTIANNLGIKKIKTYGSSLKACLIAEKKGEINLNPAPYTWEWDICASDIIIHEAGGKFTDSEGNIISYNKKNPRNRRGYLASNGPNHDRLIDQISLF